EYRGERLLGQLEDEPVLGDACVGDEHLNGAEALLDLGEGQAHVVGRRDVATDVGEALDRLLAVGDGDLIALRHECVGGRPADAPGATGDQYHAPAHQAPTAWYPPSTWTISPVVAGNQSDSSATHARATGEASDVSHPSGARASHSPWNRCRPGMDRAAIVRMGPAATRFTRTSAGPTSRAR